MAKDQSDLLAEGRLPDDPLENTEPFTGMDWNPTNENKPKTLEEWGWLTQGEPPAHDAILSRLKPGTKDPESPFLVAGKTGLFLAAGGVGKTQTFVQLAIAVASNGEFIRDSGITALNGGRVLIVCGEEDALELRRRFYWATKGLTDEVKKRVAKNITAVPLAGKVCALQAVEEISRPRQTPRLEPTHLFRDLKKIVTENDYRLVLLDPASRFMGPDAEKDNKAATNFVELLEQLTNPENEATDGKPKGPRPAVIVAHHTTKTNRNEGDFTATASRGASALTDGVRWVAQLMADKDDHDRMTFAVVKSNYTSTKRSRVELRREPGGVLRALSSSELRAEEEAEKKAKDKTPKTTTYDTSGA